MSSLQRLLASGSPAPSSAASLLLQAAASGKKAGSPSVLSSLLKPSALSSPSSTAPVPSPPSVADAIELAGDVTPPSVEAATGLTENTLNAFRPSVASVDSSVEETLVVNVATMTPLDASVATNPVKKTQVLHSAGRFIASDRNFTCIAIRGEPSAVLVRAGPEQVVIRGHLHQVSDIVMSSFAHHSLIASVDNTGRVLISAIYKTKKDAGGTTLCASTVADLSLPEAQNTAVTASTTASLKDNTTECLVRWHPTLPAILFVARKNSIYSIDLDSVGVASELFTTAAHDTTADNVPNNHDNSSINASIATSKSITRVLGAGATPLVVTSSSQWHAVVTTDNNIVAFDITSREIAQDREDAESWELGDVVLVTALAGNEGRVLTWTGTAVSPFHLYAAMDFDFFVQQTFFLRHQIHSGGKEYATFALLVVSADSPVVELVTMPLNASARTIAAEESDDSDDNTTHHAHSISQRRHIGYGRTGCALHVRGFGGDLAADGGKEDVFASAARSLSSSSKVFADISTPDHGATYRIALADLNGQRVLLLNVRAPLLPLVAGAESMAVDRYWCFDTAGVLALPSPVHNIRVSPLSTATNSTIIALGADQTTVADVSMRGCTALPKRVSASPATASKSEPTAGRPASTLASVAESTPELLPLRTVYSADAQSSPDLDAEEEPAKLHFAPPFTLNAAQPQQSAVFSEQSMASLTAAVCSHIDDALDARLKGFESSIRNVVQVEVSRSFKAAFSEVIVPAYERATQAMVSQIAERMQQDMQLYQKNIGELVSSMQEGTAAFKKQASAHTASLKQMEKAYKEKIDALTDAVAAMQSAAAPSNNSTHTADKPAPAPAPAAPATKAASKATTANAPVQVLPRPAPAPAPAPTTAAVSAPAPTPSKADAVDYEEVFTQTLEEADTEAVINACRRAASSNKPESIAAMLSPPLLLCLIQQLGASIDGKADELQLSWLSAVTSELEKRVFSNAPQTTDIRPHISGVADSVLTQLKPLLAEADASRGAAFQLIGKCLARLRIVK